MNKHSRSPKLVGDFGEGLAIYLLIRKGFEVAVVDHVGADLIAERNGNRYAISVKTRRFKAESNETRSAVFTYSHIENIEHFANRFKMTAALMHVVCLEDDKSIHAFLMKTTDMKKELKHVKNGYAVKFSDKQLPDLVKHDWLDYSVWKQEHIEKAKLF